MRCLVLSVVAAALVAPGAQAADGETCQGKPATIVQSQGNVKGTDGDDVIVGGPDTRVRARAGDDTICVTGGRVQGGDGRDSVEMRGTDVEDFILLSSVEVVDVETGAGADRVRLTTDDRMRLSGHLDGGDGEDVVSVGSDNGVTINLARSRLALRSRQHAVLTGFENAAADTWSIATLIVGDAGDNRLTLGTDSDCAGVVRGGPGDDVITAGHVDVHDTCFGITAYGEAGNDVLRGSGFDDVLIGGPGRDRAYGGDDQDNDRCRAEVRRGCESR